MTNDDTSGDRRDAVAAPGRWRWTRHLLIGSLALNLFLAGVVGVWVLWPVFRGPPPPPEVGGMMERMAARVPEADRPILRQAFGKHREDMSRLFREARQSQQAVRAALRAEPFDIGAYDAASERARQTRAAIEATMQSATREAVMAMSPEGRARFAQRGRGRGRD